MAKAAGCNRAASTPSGPSQIARDAASSETIENTASASSAASLGESAWMAPRARSSEALLAVRLKTRTSWPAARSLAAMREPMFPSPLKAILATASPASGWAQACPRGRASAPRFNCLAQNVAASVAHRAAGAPSAVVDRQNAGVIAHAVDHVLTGVLGTRSRELENQMGVVDLLSQDQSIRGMIAEERAQESGIAGVWNVGG